MENQEFREIIFPWFFVALISLTIPVVLIILSRHVPLDIGPFFPKATPGISHWVPTHWFTESPYMLIFLPSAFYWIGGLFWMIIHFEKTTGWRINTSQVLLSLSLAGLFYVLPLLSAFWCLAHKVSLMPLKGGEKLVSFHSPFMYLGVMYKVLKLALFLPLTTCILALLAFILKPNRYTAFILVISPFIFYLLFIYYSWLFDSISKFSHLPPILTQ